MKKFNRRLTLNEDESESQKKLPYLNVTQFSTKLDDLLNKVSIQNRYATRISQCNMNNMLELEKAKKELHKIEEKKKMNELNATNNQELIEQMRRKVNSSEEQLKQLFKQLIDARQQIKTLKKQISSLQKSNLQIEKQLLQIKRDKFYQVSAAKQQIEDSLLLSHVTHFLSTSPHTSTLLYQFCNSAYKKQNLSNFLNDLDCKIEGRRQDRNQSHASNTHLPYKLHEIKLKVARSSTNDKYKNNRIKTEHISNQFILNDSR